jgi:sugar lactone lactonase YvrE
VIGPTGVYLGTDGSTLYVADSVNNRIAFISNALTRTNSAGTGTTVLSGHSLNDPLGLTATSTGNIITANGDDGFMVLTSPSGTQIGKTLLDNSGNPPGSGALFGVAFVTSTGLHYVDDATNTLRLFPNQ